MTFTSALIVERTTVGSRASVKEQGTNVSAHISTSIYIQSQCNYILRHFIIKCHLYHEILIIDFFPAHLWQWVVSTSFLLHVHVEGKPDYFIATTHLHAVFSFPFRVSVPCVCEKRQPRCCCYSRYRIPPESLFHTARQGGWYNNWNKFFCKTLYSDDFIHNCRYKKRHKQTLIRDKKRDNNPVCFCLNEVYRPSSTGISLAQESGCIIVHVTKLLCKYKLMVCFSCVQVVLILLDLLMVQQQLERELWCSSIHGVTAWIASLIDGTFTISRHKFGKLNFLKTKLPFLCVSCSCWTFFLLLLRLRCFSGIRWVLQASGQYRLALWESWNHQLQSPGHPPVQIPGLWPFV